MENNEGSHNRQLPLNTERLWFQSEMAVRNFLLYIVQFFLMFPLMSEKFPYDPLLMELFLSDHLTFHHHPPGGKK